MTIISAKTILRSRNASAPEKVLSTLLLRYPRFIHAELMTHRAFSRNAASSRAIPVAKIIDDILADTAMPLHWGKNQRGMQASEECDEIVQSIVPNAFMGAGLERWSDIDPDQALADDRPAWEVQVVGWEARAAWLNARDFAIAQARAFDAAGYHKQVVNRLLEPFMHITVLVSSTEWDNFLELRDHADAEPHIAMLAREVRKCLDDESTVQTLEPGEWHLPFASGRWEGENPIDKRALIKLSVARCASTSYKTVEGFDMTLDRAVALHDKLVGSHPIHASPCEHVAMADDKRPVARINYGWHHPEQHGNFVGFRQYRHMLGEAA